MVAETPLDAALASVLEEEGRVVPIAWTLADPFFRELVGDRVRQADLDDPKLATVLRIAQAVKVEYVLTVGFTMEDSGEPRPVCRLYRSSSDRPVWQYGGEKGQEMTLTAVRTGPGIDWANTVQSWARTWSAQLANGPFQGFPARGRVSPVPLDPGLNWGETTPVPPARIDPQVLDRAAQLLNEGLAAEAISMLRDAIDVNPLDVETRVALIQALSQQDQADAAASEALLAAQLMPEQTSLRLLAARALLRVGRLSDAKAQLNEALARAAASPEADRVLGDLYLADGDRVQAMAAYERSLGQKRTFGAEFGLLVCQALEGQVDAVEKIAIRLPSASVAEQREVYRWFIALSAEAFGRVASDLKEALAQGRMNPRDPAAIGLATRALGVSRSLAVVLESLSAPPRHKKSHDRRVLAHSLLQQAAAEALDFARSGNSDTGEEATLSLGEALKQFPAVQAEFDLELLQP